MKTVFAFAGLLAASLAMADSGPAIPPCLVCPEFTRPPFPHTGHWHNPERPGTGINIDMQNGIMVAMYYGYREDGTSVWLLASGELRQPETGDAYWELEADMHETVGGQPPGDESVGGSYQEPEVEVAGQIHIEILQRNLLRFSIDGGASERMVPMVFGSHTTNYFPDGSDYRLPNFEEGKELNFAGERASTPWIIIETNPDGGTRLGYGFTGPLPHFGLASFGDTLNLLYYNFSFHDSPVHSQVSATITCGRVDDLAAHYTTTMAGMSGEEPICVAWSFANNDPANLRRYFMPIGNFGDRRFTAVSEEGWVMEGFRLMYD